MGMTQRVVLAVVLLVTDLAFFFLPLTANVLAYVIIFYPKWAKDFVKGLERPAH